MLFSIVFAKKKKKEKKIILNKYWAKSFSSYFVCYIFDETKKWEREKEKGGGIITISTSKAATATTFDKWRAHCVCGF